MTYEEDRIPVPDAGCLLQGLRPLGIEELGDRMQGQDIERVFVFERCKATARHRKRVVAEPDFSGLLVALVERIVDDPAKLEDPLLSRFELVT